MIFPKETAQFGFYDTDGKSIVPMEKSIEYTSDVLGLKTLNEAGKIKMISFPGNHL